MSKENPSYYAVIPANVRYDKKLSSSEKLMYAEITCLANKYGYCFASNNYFADLYDVSKSSISAWIKSLSDHGYIDVKYKRKGKQITQRNITLNTLKKRSQNSEHPYSEKLSTPIQKIERGCSENLKDNTTSNNNTRDNNHHQKKSKNTIPDLNSEDSDAVVEMDKDTLRNKKYMDMVGKSFANPDAAYDYVRYCVIQQQQFWELLKREWGVSKASKRKVVAKCREFATWAYSKQVPAKPPERMLSMLKPFMREIEMKEYKLVR